MKNIEIVTNARQPEGIAPCIAKTVVIEGIDRYGLVCDGNAIVDYDGCFALPGKVVEQLASDGYDVSNL